MFFRFNSVDKEFNATPLLRRIQVQANPGDRIGLIGPNGSGKTTLLNLIAGTLEPDSGEIHRSRNLSFSRILQLPDFQPGNTVRTEALRVFDGLRKLERQIEQIEHRISQSGEEIPGDLAAEYESLRVILEQQGGYDYQAHTESILLGVGFTLEEFEQDCQELSGGQANRLLVAKALLQPASMMLLDEPTNHLDLEGILWLEEFLRQSRQPFLVVSHDRHFLDQVTNRTWELEGGRLYSYTGSFSAARRQREARRRQELQLYERQQEWKEKTEEYIRRNLAGQKTKQAQARRKRLEKTTWLEAPAKSAPPLLAKIRESQRGGAVCFELKDAHLGYPGKTLLPKVNLVARRGDRIALLGANGSGKTTLFKTIMGETFLLGGDLVFGQHLTIGYLPQNPRFEGLGETVLACLRELDSQTTDQQLRSHAAAYGFRGEEAEKQVSHLSGGERSRLAMARLFYHPRNLLLLDEPTNHLDVDSREALEEALCRFSGTLIVISHDLYFVKKVANRFWHIANGKIRELKSFREITGDPTPEPERSATPTESASEKEEKRSAGASPVGLSKNERFRRQKQLEQLEQEITRLEKAKEETLTRLEQEGDFEILSELGETHDRLDEDLSQLYTRWEELAAELTGEGSTQE